MKFAQRVLPRLLLVGAGALLLELVLASSLMILERGKADGATALAALHLTSQIPLMVVCFYLARIARDYYEGRDTLRAKLLGLRYWTWALCGGYACEGLWMFSGKLARHLQEAGALHLLFVVVSALQILPVVAGLLLVQDLLTECLGLRDESALTV